MVPAAPADGEPIPPPRPCSCRPAENVFGPAPVGSILCNLGSGFGIVERSDVTIRALGSAEENDLRTLPDHVGPHGTHARSFADAVGAMREDPWWSFLFRAQGLRAGCSWRLWPVARHHWWRQIHNVTNSDPGTDEHLSCANFRATPLPTTSSTAQTWRSRRQSPGVCSFGRIAMRRNCESPHIRSTGAGNVSERHFFGASQGCSAGGSNFGTLGGVTVGGGSLKPEGAPQRTRGGRSPGGL